MINRKTELQDFLLRETERLAFVATWLRDEGKQIRSWTDDLIVTNLFIATENVDIDEWAISKQIRRTRDEMLSLRSRVRSKRSLDKAMEKCESACYETEDAENLHSLIMFGLKGLAVHVCQMRIIGEGCSEIDEFIQVTLSDLYERRLPAGALLELVLTVGKHGLEKNYGLKAPLI